MAVRMQLSRIFIREMSGMQIIELTDPASGRSFPIVIGLPEAFAIERRLKGAEVPRPQTHDLLAAVIRELGASLQRIVIDDLRQGTFFAKLVIERDGRTHLVDSRPSDAIAIGVAMDVPIFVEEEVLRAAAADAAEGGSAVPEIDQDEEEEQD